MTQRVAGGGSALVCAIDIGGTAIKAALVDADGRVPHRASRPTDASSGEAVIGAVLGAVDELRGAARDIGSEPDAIGLAVLGIVDEERGVAVTAANLPWRDLAVRELVARGTGLPTVLGHDVRAGGLAEARLGAGRAYRDFVFLPVGTGIAGAIVIDGKPYVGDGRAGEIGHVLVAPRGRRCGCGARGCLETVASAAAIGRRYTALAGREADAEHVARAAIDGDPLAAQVWREAVAALATVLATYVSLLAPQAIIIGGGLSRAGALLLDPLRDSLAGRLTFQRMPELLLAELGDAAGTIGAAVLAHRLMGRDIRSLPGEPDRQRAPRPSTSTPIPDVNTAATTTRPARPSCRS